MALRNAFTAGLFNAVPLLNEALRGRTERIVDAALDRRRAAAKRAFRARLHDRRLNDAAQDLQMVSDLPAAAVKLILHECHAILEVPPPPLCSHSRRPSLPRRLCAPPPVFQSPFLFLFLFRTCPTGVRQLFRG